MSGVIGVIIFLICATAWYLPIYKKQPAEGRPNSKEFTKALLMGMFPAFLLSIVLQVILKLVLTKAGVAQDSMLRTFLMDILGYGVGEELCKFLMAYLIIRKIGYKNKTYTVLIFGAVGLGFELLESFLSIDNVVGALVRSILALHIFFQFCMGRHYSDYIEKKNTGDLNGTKKSLMLAFVVPMIVHAINDIGASVGGQYLLSDVDSELLSGMLLLLSALVVDIVFVVVTLRKTIKLK